MVVAAGVLASAAPARACPVCDRETGRLVRAGIFDSGFLANLLGIGVPFAVCGGAAALLGRDRDRERT
jgi:hypothetical protein